MPYLAAFVLVAIDPRWRTRLLNFMLGVCVFTAVIAFLQFIKFPGALQLSGLYVDLNDLETFGLDKRSHGLSTHPFHLSAQCILGCGIVASNLLTRKLKVFEIGFYAILSAGLVVAQARSFYIAWIVITVITLVMCFKRDKQQFLTILCIMGAMVTAIIAAFPDQLSYGLSGKNTINEGRMSQWMRADELASQFPLTGIGPKETVFGSGKDFTGGGRWYTLYTESGYRMSRVSGGFIGLALMIGLVLSCLVLSVVVFRDPNADLGRRQSAFAGFYFMLAMAMGLYITNIVENELITYYGMALAGIVAPQVGEVFKSHRGRSKMLLRRLTQAQTKLPSRTA
ncbi:MAG: O-antigen ligase family protein [Chlorobia bacterium]|nr:O-antigen ligase family protein [Fimbriimonadaceae bacterium]